MGFYRGPKIVTDGLILHLDAANYKSFRGEPTTNLSSDGGLIGMSDISLDYIGIEDGWKKYSMSGTFTGGTYPYIMYVTSVSFTGGTVYTTRCIVKTNAMSKFNYFGTGMNYVNVPMDNSGVSVSTQNLDGSFTIGRTGFVYTSTTTQPGYILSNPINNTTFNSSTDFVWIKELQIEQKAYSTPFVNGSRGTTVNTGGGWADRSGNNNHGELVNGVTYNSSNLGSLVFDGVNDQIDITSNLGILSNYTIMFWAKRNSENRMSISSRTSSNFYWYGDNSWRYVHSSAGEYYYSKPTSIPLGTWGHYCVVYNGSNVSIYRQGIYQGQQSTTGTADFTGGLILGYWSLGGNYAWDGQISQVQMYNIALTETEILQNFNATKKRYGL